MLSDGGMPAFRYHNPSKEVSMDTMSAYTTERRHLPDRRTSQALSETSSRMNALDWTAMVLMIVGGINWGLIGLFNFNLVGTLFGELSALSRIIYTLVGISAVYSIYASSKMGSDRR